jgi:hypothetical protein
MFSRYYIPLFIYALLLEEGFTLKLADFTHYLDYVPRRVEGLVGGQDFRTAANPPSHLRNRKMDIGNLKIKVDDVLEAHVWPARWPYSEENFRPLDYTRDEVVDAASQYITSQRHVCVHWYFE